MPKRYLLTLLVLLFVAPLITPPTSDADSGKGNGRGIIVKRDAAEQFAVLPAGVRFPEGIAANPKNGDVFVGTFDPNGDPQHPNKLLRFDRRGKLQASKDFGGMPLVGLEFNGTDGKVYICNFGASKVQRIPADFTASTLVEDVATLPKIGPPAARTEGNPDGSSDTIIFGSNSVPAPNALAFKKNGDLFVSDSFQGASFRINNAVNCPTPCSVITVSHDPFLATAGFPPFGANGLAFTSDEKTLFIANTGDDRVLALDMATNKVSVFTELHDHAPVRVEGHDLVGLVRADPEPSRAVHDEPIGTVDALGEDRNFVGGHVQGQDAVVAGVGDEERFLVTGEGEAVGAERREAGGGQERVVGHRDDGARRGAVDGVVDPEDGALERIRDEEVAVLLEGQRVRSRDAVAPEDDGVGAAVGIALGSRGRRSDLRERRHVLDQRRRREVGWDPLDLGRAEVADVDLAVRSIELEPEERHAPEILRRLQLAT